MVPWGGAQPSVYCRQVLAIPEPFPCKYIQRFRRLQPPLITEQWLSQTIQPRHQDLLDSPLSLTRKPPLPPSIPALNRGSTFFSPGRKVAVGVPTRALPNRMFALRASAHSPEKDTALWVPPALRDMVTFPVQPRVSLSGPPRSLE